MEQQNERRPERLIDRVLDYVEDRRNNILEGRVNCIPSPFAGFRKDFIGIEQGRYYLISSQQKGGKTQFTSFAFVYNALSYALEHPEKLRLKIFYYPLEEKKEDITLRFMSYLLYVKSGKRYRISPEDLSSTNENKVLSQDVINILKSPDYRRVLDFFEKTIIFEESQNPTGVWKDLTNYAKTHGTIHYNTIKVKNEFGEEEEKNIFDYYEANDPNEYVMILFDHVSLTGLERGMDLRQSIMKLSEYMVNLRNRFNYIPVVIQQQSDETQNLQAYKAGKIRPNSSGLADSKYTFRDADIFLGIVNPYSYEIPKYLGYDIVKLKDHIRFLEVVANRHGRSKGITALYFDGATSYFKELPKPTEVAQMHAVYAKIARIEQMTNGMESPTNPALAMFSHFINKVKMVFSPHSN